MSSQSDSTTMDIPITIPGDGQSEVPSTIPEIGPLVPSEREKNLAILYKIQEAERRAHRITLPDVAKEHNYKFWGTQPVPSFDDKIVRFKHMGALELTAQREFKNTNGVSNYHWSEFTDEEFSEMYYTETERYTVRSSASTVRAWCQMGERVFRVGIRRTSNGVLVGAIIARQVTSTIMREAHPLIEVGWMFIAPQYRALKMSVFLMHEMRRVAQEAGYDIGVFQTSHIVPSPSISWTNCIRELQPEKLTSLITVKKEESISEKIRTYTLIDELRAEGLRQAIHGDAEAIAEFLNDVNTYTVWRKWTTSQIEHLIANAHCWVCVRDDEVTDFVAWVDQEWIPRTPWNEALPVVRVAQVIVQVYGSDSLNPVTRVVTDLMVHALRQGYHIFQTDKIGEAELYTTNLRFVEWGYPNYMNTYNFSIPAMINKQIGVPVAWNI